VAKLCELVDIRGDVTRHETIIAKKKREKDRGI
jgi:hypothetical protein